MPTILHILSDPSAIDVNVSDAMLRITLADGREVAAPLAWFPRLREATTEQRLHWRLIGCGEGIHWPDVNEDVSIRQPHWRV